MNAERKSGPPRFAMHHDWQRGKWQMAMLRNGHPIGEPAREFDSIDGALVGMGVEPGDTVLIWPLPLKQPITSQVG
jgi:hypothetical protein